MQLLSSSFYMKLSNIMTLQTALHSVKFLEKHTISNDFLNLIRVNRNPTKLPFVSIGYGLESVYRMWLKRS